MLLGGTTSNTRSAVVWKMVLSCLLWCLWREVNDRGFEDCERTLEEIKSFFFQHIVSLDNCFCISFVISYHDFFVLFASTS
jgi:hypothetical protein